MSLPAGDTELVQIMDAALAEAARRAGQWLACRPGCTQCCHGAFAINALDAERLRTGMAMLRREQPALALVIEQRARAWLDEYLPSFPGNPATGLLGQTDEDQARFEDFANDAPCPALNPATGLCDVYTWRPMTCRVFGPPVRMEQSDALNMEQSDALNMEQSDALNMEQSDALNMEQSDALNREQGDALGCCELCFVGATEAEVAACEMPIPHELEDTLLRELGQPGETVVAFALLPAAPASHA